MNQAKNATYTILNQPLNEEACMSELIRALDYLNKTNDPGLICDGEEGFKPVKSINFLVSLLIFEEIKDTDTIFETYNAFQMFSNILSYLADKINEFDFKNCSPIPKWQDPNANKTINERRIHILGDMLALINFIIPRSMKLRLFMIDKNRLKNFISLLGNQNFLMNGSVYDFQLMKSIVFDINWMSKSADVNKSDWKKLNAIPTLVNTLKVAESLKVYIYMAIANIADDNEIEEITEIHQSIDTFVGLANQAADDIKNGCEMITRQQFTDDDDNHKIMAFDVTCVLDKTNNATISVTGILLAIYRLSINPKSKLNIYNKTNFKHSLSTFLTLGSEIEKLYSIQILAQLIFDSNVLADLVKDSLIMKIIRDLAEDSTNKIERLKKIAKQMVWSCDEETKKSQEKEKYTDNKEDISDDDQHIMISYNTGSRDLCLKIKYELEKENHRVWIDINEIHGSSLDSMAKAVEKSKCVLMCVTEKYRQSLNCQVEAQYSFRRNKNIIPVIMQKGYHNVDGWLGFIIGDKIFVDFTKYSFEDSIKRLKNQINLITNDKPLQPIQSNIMQANSNDATTAAAQTSQTSGELDSKFIKMIINEDKKQENKISYEKINKWTENEVNSWFKENKLNNSFIYTALFPCTGQLISQLHQIQLYAPEFFYKSISNNELKLNDLKDVASFSMALKKLFE